MKFMRRSRAVIFTLMSFILAGCFGSGTKHDESDICELLDENDEWLQPLANAQSTYGTPVSLTLALLEQPLSEFDKPHVLPRTADWDEYRVRSENWSASPRNIKDAVDFVGWFSRESTKRNKISWDDVSAHYLSYRLGHGGYHRYDAEKYPELRMKAEKVEQRAIKWQQSLKQCQSRWQNERWFSKLKFW